MSSFWFSLWTFVVGTYDDQNVRLENYGIAIT